MSTLVKTFMHQPVACLALPSNVGSARDLMKQKNCHAIPLVDVMEEDQVQVQGIVTSTDLVGVFDDTVSIRQVMTTPVQIVGPDDTAQAAAQQMVEHDTHHLLVMEGDRIVGMVSSLDFVGLVSVKGI
jgi:CBS domain-containing protein